jgi:hypothetical protein
MQLLEVDDALSESTLPTIRVCLLGADDAMSESMLPTVLVQLLEADDTFLHLASASFRTTFP